MESTAPPILIDALKRQKYHFVGNHSAVKACRWLNESLTQERSCYKQKFYGIKTHQCIQMTPTVFYCTQQCLFCWRAQNQDLKTEWSEMSLPNWDSPETIVEGCIETQRKILTGYGGNPKTDAWKHMEAFNPKHVAISLAGEPTLYENLGGLLRAFHNRGLTTFLVSNGTVPSALSHLDCEPTQMYISVCAPDEETYNAVCRPQVARGWTLLNQTLANLHSFKCPTVMRITSVRGLSLKNASGYAELVEKANPTHIEVKAYMHVGFSRLRLGFEGMPSHEEIKEFAQTLATKTGYDLIDESVESRVVLLSRLRKALRFGNG